MYQQIQDPIFLVGCPRSGTTLFKQMFLRFGVSQLGVNMQTSSIRRIFLVGCPRSGTTLLQSLLTAHSQIVSFPESHFFRYLTFEKRHWQLLLGNLGIAPLKVRQRFIDFLGEIDQKQMETYLPNLALFASQYSHAFIKLLDALTEQEGKQVWIEKTPMHLHHINLIEKLIPEVKFIHIVRNGIDVVASQYEVTHKYPEIWGGERDIDQCIRRWMGDISLSKKHLNKPNHTLVRYERLVDNPQSILEMLCSFIGVDFEKSMLQEYSAAAKQVVLQSEPWKTSVQGKIQSTNSKKFYELFDEAQRAYILNRIEKIDLEQLEKVNTVKS